MSDQLNGYIDLKVAHCKVPKCDITPVKSAVPSVFSTNLAPVSQFQVDVLPSWKKFFISHPIALIVPALQSTAVRVAPGHCAHVLRGIVTKKLNKNKCKLLESASKKERIATV